MTCAETCAATCTWRLMPSFRTWRRVFCRLLLQYPLCGSSRCNSAMQSRLRLASDPAVSSIWVESLQPALYLFGRRLPNGLSVPSTRVESLQRTVSVIATKVIDDLSVPSTRVESLQLMAATTAAMKQNSFSILHAGRVAATRRPTYHRIAYQAFQYPPSGSSRCNVCKC
jgi:hypothetical protein